MKDCGQRISLGYTPTSIPKKLSHTYQLNERTTYSYFDLRESNFQGNEIIGFNPEYFRFSDYTFDRDYLEREWPQYLIDERVPFELRNAIYEVDPVWFMQVHAQYFVFKYLPYFTPEILKRISRIFKLGYDVCIPGEPKMVYEIVQLLIAWYEADPKWYELVHEECI